jgi:thiol-disulfide isomerase/thioredoxin
MSRTKRLAAGALVLAVAGMALAATRPARLEAGGAVDPQSLVGHKAPDFQGDFALNGRPIKLSDLKCKVVVVEFWAVWCRPCVADFPNLDRWYNKYKDQGLEIVAATLYNHDFGRAYSFDKLTGKVSEAKEANKESEQEMLANFAAYHKLKFLLMTLPKEEAVPTLKNYGIKGIPHTVVIDRKGMVRLVSVGADDANNKAIEMEFVKLLDEQG